MSRTGLSRRISDLFSRLSTALKARGITHVLRSLAREAYPQLRDHAAFFYHRTFKSNSTFLFRGKPQTYFYHMYGRTWRNERCVEVPIVWELVKKYREKSILEVGHVLSNYFSFEHDIVDKYEKVDGVINADIVDFNPPKKYELIVGISTLEHIGLYENPQRPDKVLEAFENLKSLLAPSGRILVTLPMGFNPVLDKYLDTREIGFTEAEFLKRISLDRWTQVSWEEARATKYNSPFPNANALVIGMITQDGAPIA